MRDGKWKVIAKLDLEKKYVNLNNQNIATIKQAQFVDYEVYKITADIGESKNVLLGKPNKKSSLKKKLEREYRQLLDDSFIWTVKE